MISNNIKRFVFAVQTLAIIATMFAGPQLASASLLGGLEFPSFDFPSLDLELDSPSLDLIVTRTTCKLSASANQVDYGDSVTMTWETEGFDTVKINGQSYAAMSGDVTFDNLTEDTTYTLIATNDNGDTCKQVVRVGCNPPPVIYGCTDPEAINYNPNATKDDHSCEYEEMPAPTCEVSISPKTIYKGDSATITWESENASLVTINRGIGEVELNGSRQITPNQTLSYDVMVTGENGDVIKCWETITVIEKPTPGCTDPNAVNYNPNATENDHSCKYVQVCEPGDQYYNPEADLTGSIYAEGKGKVTNSSDYCEYKIGLASYEKFDEVIDNQKIFDSAVGTVGPNSMEELHVTVPNCAYQIDLFYGDVLQSLDGQRYGTRKLDWAHLNSDKGYCGEEEPKDATLIAHKVVCTDEADLPNWGNGGPDITANTAADWVANHASCRLESGWEFEWAGSNTSNPDTDVVNNPFFGTAGGDWNTFGVTGANGSVSTVIPAAVIDANTNLWVREVLQTGFIPFTFGPGNTTNADDVSSEMYCHVDVKNYDNYDRVDGLAGDETYHCVAFNSPVLETPAPSCDMFTASPDIITVGGTATLAWESTNAVQAFLNNAIGAVDVDGTFEVSPLADTVYRLTLIGAEDKTADCEVPVTVTEKLVPICKEFAATPSTLPVGGGTVNLAWEVRNASTVTIDNEIGTVSLVGNQSVTVIESTTYTLTATDVDGTDVSCIAPVAVADPTPVFTCADNVTFTANDTSITRGDDVELNWNVTGADSISITDIASPDFTGSASVSPTSDTTYTLVATQGSEQISCPLTIDVSSNTGGGGGSASPRCELEISASTIESGDEITLTWETRSTRELTITDDRGNVIITTTDKLADDKEEFFDGEITLRPTRDTEYTLVAERGSRDRECSVEVEIESDDIVILETRDQAPLVAGISLSEVPHTGFEAGPFMTTLFYMLLIGWALYLTYALVIPKNMLQAVALPTEREIAEAQMSQAEAIRPDVFAPVSVTNSVTHSAAAPVAPAPVNLPVAQPAQVAVAPTMAAFTTATSSVEAAALEAIAHNNQALLSSEAIKTFVAAVPASEQLTKIVEVVNGAKAQFPQEDGWVVINNDRMFALLVA